MKNPILVLCMVVLWSGLIARADAAGVLRLSDGFETIIVADQGLGDGNGAIGALSHTGSFLLGGQVMVITALSRPAVGDEVAPRLELSVETLNLGFAMGVVTAEWTDDGFGPLGAGQGFVSSVTGTATGPMGGVTISTRGDAGNSPFGDDGVTAQSSQFFPIAPFAGTVPAPLGGPLPGPYSLTVQGTVQLVGMDWPVFTAVLEANAPAGNTLPVAVVQDVFADAGPDCSVEVSAAQVDAGSHDPDGDPLTLSLDPAGPYALGETLVTLTVDDGMGGTDSAMALVTVLDGTPPMIECPEPITVGSAEEVPLPDPASVTTWDNCGIAEVIWMGDVSDGMTNPETILRTYLAADDSGNAAECIQRITVGAPSADALLAALIADTESLPLPRGIRNALLAKLQNARRLLLAGQTRPAAYLLKAFVQHVRAQRGKRLDADTADTLIAGAKAVLEAIPSPMPPAKGRDSRVDSPRNRP